MKVYRITDYYCDMITVAVYATEEEAKKHAAMDTQRFSVIPTKVEKKFNKKEVFGDSYP